MCQDDYKKKLIKYLCLESNQEESIQDFENTKIFVFYFTLIWNLFEKYCFKNCLSINKIQNFSKKKELLDLDIGTIFEFFKKAYNLDCREGYKDDEFSFNNSKYSFRFIAIKGYPDPNNKEIKYFNEDHYYKLQIVKKALTTNNQDQTTKIECLLYLMYRIRNNLFHGKKDPRYIEEQEELFALSNSFLLDVITKIQPKNNDSPY